MPLDFTSHFSALKQARIPLVALTAYDYPTARLLEETGVVDLILVGDSLGMMVLGYPDTTSVTLADIVHHTRAVARACHQTPIIADLPIHTYNTPDAAIANSQILLEAGAQAVKLEGGLDQIAILNALVAAHIPVMGHIGMLPQHIQIEGTYRIKGKTPEEAQFLSDSAMAIEDAGAFAIVLELTLPTLAATLSKQLSIPTIGIGSGNRSECDGQIRVFHDIVGGFPWFCPKFVTPHLQSAKLMQDAVLAFAEQVRGTVSS